MSEESRIINIDGTPYSVQITHSVTGKVGVEVKVHGSCYSDVLAGAVGLYHTACTILGLPVPDGVKKIAVKTEEGKKLVQEG